MRSVKVIDYTPQVKSKNQRQMSVFLRLALEDVHRLSKPTTPRDLGNLAKDVLKTVAGLTGTIEWRKAYAAYQERGSRADGSRKVRQYSTPGTGPGFAYNAVMTVVKNTKEYVLKATRL